MVIWKTPQYPNGPVLSYLVTFRRGDVSTSVVSDPLYPYYVIQPRDIPDGVGPVTVEVHVIIIAFIIFTYVREQLCLPLCNMDIKSIVLEHF